VLLDDDVELSPAFYLLLKRFLLTTQAFRHLARPPRPARAVAPSTRPRQAG